MMVNVWQSNHVRLRAVEPEDWQNFATSNRDTETARHSYHIPFPQSDEAARRWAEKEALRTAEQDVFRWVIENLEGDFVGTINTHSCDQRNGTFSYGLAVRNEHQRKGYASEAIRIVLRYYFSELRYQKVVAHVYSFNEPSIRLHQQLGFQLEGRIRRMIYTHGQFFDDLIFGLIAEEFAGNNNFTYIS
jgi:RimJ/RimL family protein N-acetyltransferase